MNTQQKCAHLGTETRALEHSQRLKGQAVGAARVSTRSRAGGFLQPSRGRENQPPPPRATRAGSGCRSQEERNHRVIPFLLNREADRFNGRQEKSGEGLPCRGQPHYRGLGAAEVLGLPVRSGSWLFGGADLEKTH